MKPNIPPRVTVGPVDYFLACLLPIAAAAFWKCRIAADRLDVARLNRAGTREGEKA